MNDASRDPATPPRENDPSIASGDQHPVAEISSRTPSRPRPTPTVNAPSHANLHPLRILRSVLGDLVRHRELIWILFQRDLKAQFRQSLFGYGWLLLPPLLTTVVWVFLNRQQIVSVPDTGMPYPVFVLVGTIVWQSLVRLLQMPLIAFDAGRSVFTRMKVPVEVFLAAGSLRAIFDFAVYAAILIPVFLYYGVAIAATAPAFVIVVAALITLGTAIGLALVPIGGLYSDIKHAVPIVMGPLLYLAPVIYPPPSSGLASHIIRYNPATPILMAARHTLIEGRLNDLPAVLLVMAISVVVLMIGLVALRIVTPHLIVRLGT